ncbi:MAG: cytochrome C [Roseobacter sp.]
MTRTVATIAAIFFAAAPAFADGHAGSGDASAGEKTFNKCKSCHMIVSDTGEAIVKGGRTGPNLYGVIGRTAGSTDFRYSDSLIAAGQAGLVWDAENLVAFAADPRGFLKSYLDDSKAKSRMAYRLKKGGEDVAAYLATFSDAGES